MINKHYFNERSARSHRAINAHRTASRRHMNEGVVVTAKTDSTDNCFTCLSMSDLDITEGLFNSVASDMDYYYANIKDSTFLYLQQVLYSLCDVAKNILTPYCQCKCQCDSAEDDYNDVVVDERTIVPASKKNNRK